jgi:hypothetical protein
MVKMTMKSHIILRMRSRLALSLSVRNHTLHLTSLYLIATLSLCVMMRTMMKMALSFQAKPIQLLFCKVWNFNSSLNNRCSSIRMVVQGQPASFNSSRPKLWAANIILRMMTTKKRSWMLTSLRSSWNFNSSNSSNRRGQATRLSKDAKILTNSTSRMRKTMKMREKRTKT